MEHAKGPKKRTSNPATELSDYVHRLLEEGEKGKPTGLMWEKNSHALRTKETVDIVGLKGNQPKVLLEIERLRENPEANILKVWMWLSKKRKLGNKVSKVFFFQAFSNAYKDKKAPRKKRALFLAAKMCHEFKEVKYKDLPFGLKPKRGAKGIGGASKREAKKMIAEMLKKLGKIASGL